ncbi:MAG: hypothetical protein LBU47_00355 [Christensenellaceae bacterium]|jgi:hypothetical protein|nr:hypothetical protein [Christensenellaceae bacterium]
MNKNSLDRIRVPQGLLHVTDRAIERAQRDEERGKTPKFIRRAAPLVAAALALVFISLNFGVIAEAASKAFLSLRSGALNNPSRDQIVENGFVAPVTQQPDATTDEKNRLTLQNYYIAGGEIGFDLLLSGVELPENFNYAYISDFALELQGGTGESKLWEASYDFENEIDRRDYPGGHFLLDWTNGAQERHEYVESDYDFIQDAVAERLGENSVSIAFVVRFRKPLDAIGSNLKLRVNTINFIELDDISVDVPQDVRTALSGDWSFELEVDERFIKAQELVFSAVGAEAAKEKGIELQSVKIDPSATRIEIAIDYSKNKLVDRAKIQADFEEEYWPKFYVFETTLFAEANGKTLRNRSWDFHLERQKGDLTFLWAELDSVYFDDVEAFNLILTEIDGNRIEIPVQIVK